MQILLKYYRNTDQIFDQLRKKLVKQIIQVLVKCRINITESI
jgi:hypothetical protein